MHINIVICNYHLISVLITATKVNIKTGNGNLRRAGISSNGFQGHDQSSKSLQFRRGKGAIQKCLKRVKNVFHFRRGNLPFRVWTAVRSAEFQQSRLRRRRRPWPWKKCVLSSEEEELSSSARFHFWPRAIGSLVSLPAYPPARLPACLRSAPACLPSRSPDGTRNPAAWPPAPPCWTERGWE